MLPFCSVDKKPEVVEQVVYDEFSPTDLSVAERRLFTAVILRAVLDYQSKAPEEVEHRRTARIFLFSDDPELSPLREYLELMFSRPDAVLERLRDDVKHGRLKPKQIAAFC